MRRKVACVLVVMAAASVCQPAQAGFFNFLGKTMGLDTHIVDMEERKAHEDRLKAAGERANRDLLEMYDQGYMSIEDRRRNELEDAIIKLKVECVAMGCDEPN